MSTASIPGRLRLLDLAMRQPPFWASEPQVRVTGAGCLAEYREHSGKWIPVGTFDELSDAVSALEARLEQWVAERAQAVADDWRFEAERAAEEAAA